MAPWWRAKVGFPGTNFPQWTIVWQVAQVMIPEGWGTLPYGRWSCLQACRYDVVFRCILRTTGHCMARFEMGVAPFSTSDLCELG